MAVSEYDDKPTKFPGSDGDVDLEYTPRREGWYRPHPDLRPLGDVVRDHEQRIAHLESIVHRYINLGEAAPPNGEHEEHE